jgi:uncharacterized membrane protein
MLLLIIAALVWIGIHLGIAGTRIRDRFVARIGEVGFQGAFSIASLVSISALVMAFKGAPAIPLWSVSGGARVLLAAIMLVAFVFLVGSVTVRNPTAAGQPIGTEPKGLVRVTRHPMLWAFALWAAVHVIGNGDAAALVFFGAFLVTALAGMPSIDAKLARRNPEGFAALASRTSVIPFAAIAAGRNRFVVGEIGALVLVPAVLAWGLVFYFHPAIFGVSALRG